MTSGNFTNYPLANITILREDRQRRELLGIEELAESISRVGLIHPIVITHQGVLVAGERRLTAMKHLGWDKCPVQFAEDLSPDELKVIELEENVKRQDISWQDHCLAIDAYHKARSNEDSSWTAAATAKALNLNAGDLSRKLELAEEIHAGNTRVVDAPRWTTASKIVSRTNERKKAAIEEAILGDAPEPQPSPEIPILHGDFNEWAASYSGPKFNFIHCDFPYGINAGKHDQGSAYKYGGYEDTPEIYQQLLHTLASAMDSVVAQSAHLMFWFSMTKYQETVDALTSIGWIVDRFPLIWYASDNAGVAPDPQRGPRRVYETCLFARRGDRKVVQAVSNHYSHPRRDKTIHMSEKPVPVLSHFFRMLVDDHTTLLDPTCGSANALKAASQLSAARVFGIEKEKEFYDDAVRSYAE